MGWMMEDDSEHTAVHGVENLEEKKGATLEMSGGEECEQNK
jgi:hypothetical protein